MKFTDYVTEDTQLRLNYIGTCTLSHVVYGDAFALLLDFNLQLVFGCLQEGKCIYDVFIHAEASRVTSPVMT